MGAKKGHPKYGGRVKGTPNKSTVTLQQKCDDAGLDVFEAMIDLAQNDSDVSVRMTMLKELASYLYAKRKPLEAPEDTSIEVGRRVEEIKSLSTEQQIKMLEAGIRKLKGGA